MSLKAATFNVNSIRVRLSGQDGFHPDEVRFTFWDYRIRKAPEKNGHSHLLIKANRHGDQLT
jgi:exonuclease III